MLKRADVASLVSTLSGFWISINALVSPPWGSCPFPKHRIQRISVSQALAVFNPACCSQTPGLGFTGQGRKPSDVMLASGSFEGTFGVAITQQPLCRLPGLGNQSPSSANLFYFLSLHLAGWFCTCAQRRPEATRMWKKSCTGKHFTALELPQTEIILWKNLSERQMTVAHLNICSVAISEQFSQLQRPSKTKPCPLHLTLPGVSTVEQTSGIASFLSTFNALR